MIAALLLVFVPPTAGALPGELTVLALIPELPIIDTPDEYLDGEQLMRCNHTGGGICTVGLQGFTDYEWAFIYYCTAAYCKYSGSDDKYSATEGKVTLALRNGGNPDHQVFWSWSCDFPGACDAGVDGEASTYTYLEGTGKKYPSAACGSFCHLPMYWGVGVSRQATLVG